MAAIQIYSASAGSGKTFTLVQEYLKILFRNAGRGNYTAFRTILAITFTNKATEEMKQRIIGTLKGIAAGTEPAMTGALEAALPDHQGFGEQAHEILVRILHDYSSFNILTIDSFFQEIIRSFARELNLPLNFEIELNTEAGIEHAVEALTAEIGYDDELTRWLEQYALSRLNDDKHWNFNNQLKDISREIFKEEVDLSSLKKNAGRIDAVRKEFKATIAAYEAEVAKVAGEILRLMDESDIPADAFYNTWIKNLEKARDQVASFKGSYTPTFLGQMQGDKRMTKKGMDEYGGLKAAMETAHFEELCARLHHLLTEGSSAYITAKEGLYNIYAVGVLYRIHENLKRFRSERNLLFIADAARMISGFIELGDMPFLFEKIGSRLKYIFIDEFQDTSTLQWNNILPVLLNILGASPDDTTVLLVGDAKQSIYRWRGGDYKLLTDKAAASLQPFPSRVRNLNVNYRSLPEIVSFNNRFFETAIDVVRERGDGPLVAEMQSTFAEVAQEALPATEKGYVQVDVLPKGNKEEWKAAALEVLQQQLAGLQERGFAMHDIAVLARTRAEGVEISQFLQGLGIEVLSQETLLVRYDRDVRLLLAGLYFIRYPEEPLHYVNLLWQYHRKHGIAITDKHEIFADHRERALLRRWLPELCAALPGLTVMPFYQLLDSLTLLLQTDQENLFAAHFRQLAFDFFKRESGSLGDFLDWWAAEEERASVHLENGADKIHILTIHKAKGLEFPVVIIPFCDWQISGKLHEQLLWLQSPEVAGGIQLPYRVVKALEQTVFQGVYEAEKMWSWMDSINTLYVALTRPKKALFLMFPDKPGSSLPSNISGLLHAVMQKWGKEGEGSYHWGSLPAPPVPSGTEDDGSHPPPPARKDKLPEITLRSGFESGQTRIGELVHLALYYCRSNEPEQAFRKAVGSTLFSDEEIGTAQRHYQSLLANETYRNWMDRQEQAWDEQEILFRGKRLRPDKIMRLKDRYLVLDYKTGEPQPAYQKKVGEYMEAVREIFDDLPVEGYILYTESSQLEQVL